MEQQKNPLVMSTKVLRSTERPRVRPNPLVMTTPVAIATFSRL
jgi:hypothetical protein